MARIGRKNIKEQLTFNEVDLVAISLGSRKPTFVACLLISLQYVPSLLALKKPKRGKGGKGCFLYYCLARTKGLKYIFCNRKNSLCQK